MDESFTTTKPAVSASAKAVLLGGSCFTLLAGASIAPALPGIYAAFQTTPNAALLSRGVLTIGPLFMAIGASISGLLVDRIGRRPLLIASILGTGMAGTAGYFMDSLYTLLMTRVLLGLAVGGVMTACVTLLGDFFVDDERRRFLGYQTSAMKFGAVLFLIIGGMLAGISWRHPFLVDLLALLVLPGAWLAIREPAPRVSPAGAAASTLPPATPADRSSTRLVLVTALLAQILFFAIPSQLPFFMTNVLKESPQRVGLIIAVTTLTSALLAPLYPLVSARISVRGIFILIFGFLGAGLLVLSVATDLRSVILAMLLVGAGVGFLVPNLTWLLLESTHAARRGRAVGGMNTAQFIGQFASPIVTALPVGALGIPATFMGLGITSMLTAAAFLAFGGAWSERTQRETAGHVPRTTPKD